MLAAHPSYLKPPHRRYPVQLTREGSRYGIEDYLDAQYVSLGGIS